MAPPPLFSVSFDCLLLAFAVCYLLATAVPWKSYTHSDTICQSICLQIIVFETEFVQKYFAAALLFTLLSALV